MIQKEQFIILLKKIDSIIDSQDISKWPGTHIVYAMGSDVHRIEVTINRSHISVCPSYDNKKLGFEFKVGSHSITSNHKFPMYGLRWTCPIYREWKHVCKRVMSKHKLNEDIKKKKEMEEQIDTFNDLYYHSFPEEIDSILFDDDDD